jgi:hypothetical protein
MTPLRAENTVKCETARTCFVDSLPIERQSWLASHETERHDCREHSSPAKLSERSLTKRCVSRTPLRDGMKLLAGDGLIDLVPNLGAFVANPTPPKSRIC